MLRRLRNTKVARHLMTANNRRHCPVCGHSAARRCPAALITLLSFLFPLSSLLSPLHAQESQTAYNFLRLPVSAHVAALGGDNITLTDDDATLIFHNPSLINGVSDKTVNLNYMTYMEGCKTASAAFVKGIGDRGTWGVIGQYMRRLSGAGQVLCQRLGPRRLLRLCPHQYPQRRHHRQDHLIAYRRLQFDGRQLRPWTELL